jgi:N utilization substance protein A
MSKALIAGINQVATDKGLDREVIFTAIEAALVSAYKRNYGSVANVSAEVDRMSGDMHVFAEREVVEDVMNPRTEITLGDAQKVAPMARLGDVVKVLSQPGDFGRIAAQTAKQVILQRIREAERDTVYENFAHHVGEIITAQVRSVDALSGAVTVLLNDKQEVLLMRDEQIPGEKLRRGDFAKVYVVDVHKSTRGPVIKISRTHRNLLKRLMEQEIPEVRDGTVEIKSIAREPGARSKVAVIATKPDVDPVGSCVGQRGLRIQNIVNELAGEKIDVVQWSNEPVTYISNALSPAKVNSVLLEESNSAIKTAIVIVPDRQLSLAIGKEGQNARLAAKLTGWRIDIKSESEAEAEGLDRLAIEQAHKSRGEDLLARAERILMEARETSAADDRLSQAARALESLPQTPIESVDLDSLIELPPLESIPSGERSRWDAVVEELSKTDLPSRSGLGEAALPEAWETEPSVTEAPDQAETPGEEQGVETPSADQPSDPAVIPNLVTSDELPQIITADMLRARRAQRKAMDFGDKDFEIPAELLAGYQGEAEDEPDVEEMEEDFASVAGGKGKEKPKAKKAVSAAKPEKKAKKQKKWRPALPEDDLDDLY